MTKLVAGVWTVVLGASCMGLAAQPMLGIGLGPAQASGGGWTLGNVELHAELNWDAWLCSRFTVLYLPPLLAGEVPSVLFSWGARLGLGESLRTSLSLGVGGLVSSTSLRGFVPSFAFSGGLGVEVWITETLGLFLSAYAILAQRPDPYGPGFYPYFPWSVGIVVAPAGRPRTLPVGVEE